MYIYPEKKIFFPQHSGPYFKTRGFLYPLYPSHLLSHPTPPFLFPNRGYGPPPPFLGRCVGAVRFFLYKKRGNPRGGWLCVFFFFTEIGGGGVLGGRDRWGEEMGMGIGMGNGNLSFPPTPPHKSRNSLQIFFSLFATKKKEEKRKQYGI